LKRLYIHVFTPARSPEGRIGISGGAPALKQTTVYGKPYSKRGDFYTAVKKSVLNYYPSLEPFKECLNATAARENDVVHAAASRKRRFGDTVTSESIADERKTAYRRLHSASTAHEH
jgi:L-amino acid N-acyltransferase YncA